MKIKNALKNLSDLVFESAENKSHKVELKAGTGFMKSLSDSIKELEDKGYTENLVPEFDHLSFQSGAFKIYPHEFFIDEMLRFENSSDPDDQSILYAIACPRANMKGLYAESYGIYHDELSVVMLERIKYCRSLQRISSTDSEVMPVF